MKYFMITAALLVGTVIAPAAYADDDNIDVTSTIDTVSQYVFRGVSLGGNSVQPGTEISFGNLTVGSWYSAGFGPDSDVQADELDLYAGYSVPLNGDISLDIGGTYYHYPQSGDFLSTNDGASGSYEVYGSAGFASIPLSPIATVYYDFTLETLTLEGSVGHSIDLPRDGWTADLGLTGGHVEADGGGSYQWGTGTIAANKVITDAIGFYISGNFTVNSEDNTLGFDRELLASGRAVATRDSSTQFWLGTGISASY